MTNPFKLISTKKIYENPWISVDEDIVEKSGRQGLFGVVTMNSGSTILALDEEDNILFSQEFKYALGRIDLNLPGGSIDPDETPLECAKREMEEEIGYQADEWVSLGYVHPLTTLLKQTENLFLARKLRKTKNHEDDWEEIKIVRIPFQEALEKAWNGEITHAGSVVAILKAQKYINND